MSAASVQLSAGASAKPETEASLPPPNKESTGQKRVAVLLVLVIFIGLMTLLVGHVREKHKERREKYLEARLKEHSHLSSDNSTKQDIVTGLAAW